MEDEFQTIGVGDQCISGDSGGGLVGAGEAAVDDQQFAAALDRGFAFFSASRARARLQYGNPPAPGQILQRFC